MLHTLWSKAVGTSDYVKDEWLALEWELIECLPVKPPVFEWRVKK